MGCVARNACRDRISASADGVVEIFLRVLWSCEQLWKCGVRIAGPDCHQICVEKSTGSFKFIAPQSVQVVRGVLDFSM